MALLYGKPTEHAIRALIYLAVKGEGRTVAVQEIAGAEDISAHHLSKVMNALAQNKLVKPVRGPSGGFQLLVNPLEVTLWDLMAILDSQAGFKECALGWTECHDDRPCPLHDEWVRIREQNQQYLERVTIADLAVASLKKAEDDEE